MHRIRPQRLQSKFLLGLLAIMVAMALLFVLALNGHLKRLVEVEVREKADLVLTQVGSIQTYVRQVLRPIMYTTLAADEFILEAMSTSFVTRRVMDEMNAGTHQFRYRRVAQGARNPDFEATAEELELIAFFRDHPRQTRTDLIRQRPEGEELVVARAVVLEASCLHCHGQPEAAPKVLIDRYGAHRGFQRQVGEIIGADIVSLPVAGAIPQIRGATVSLLLLFIAGATLIFGIINVFFNRLVVFNLHRAQAVLAHHFPEESPPVGRVEADSGDEIEALQNSMEQFAGRLKEARQELTGYAANLETRVAERTADARREADERRTDVALFVSLLDGLNRSAKRRELLDGALAAIARRFQATAAIYVCGMMGGERFYAWPQAATPDLPQGWQARMAEGVAQVEPGRVLLPVQTSEESRGLLYLAFAHDHQPDEQGLVVLKALAHQLGIALDALDALDAVLRQNEALESIFEGIADPLVLLAADGQVLLANSAARRLESGSSPSALHLLFSGSHSQALSQRAQAAMVHGRPASWEVRLADNRSFQVSLYPVAGYQAQGGRLVGYARENTVEKRMLAQVQQNEKVAAVGRLAAGLAHEINNPVGVILCYAELLRSAVATDQAREDLEVIVRHAHQAQKILGDLLGFVRPKRSDPGLVDLGDVAATVVRVFQVQATTDRVRLTAEVAPDLPLVQGDASAVEQILSNLLVNAFDAVAPGTGEICVRVGRDAGGRVTLGVHDNGQGIAEADLARIFDPFFTTKEVGRGTGLGLAVVFGLVEEMKGSIRVDSDGGAHFVVTLPPAPESTAALASAQEEGHE